MRPAAEWLLLPLFLLPFVLGGALALWAKGAHDAALAPYREDARRAVRAWVSPPTGRAAWMTQRVSRAFGPGGEAFGGPDADAVPFTHPRFAGRVLLPGHRLGPGTWTFAADLPTGLPAAALEDADLRLALEGGRPPVAVEGVDPAALVLRDLLAVSAPDADDLEALRTASLPASTKRFVVGRWGRAPDVLRLVDAVRRAERALARRDDAPPIGLHDLDGLTAIATGGGGLLLLPDGGPGGDAFVLEEPGDEDLGVRLAWVFPPDLPVAGTEIWRGRVEAPLAGTFVFSRMGGGAWWQSPAVGRWGGPVTGLLLLFLALPVVLLLELRRRRRLDEARVRFINEMAHDLRTPLTSLRLHAEMLKGGKGKSERRDAYLGTLARESARLSDLLENLLDVARLERGRRTFDLARVRVVDVVRAAAEAFVRLRPERGADLALDGDETVVARADAVALGRVLSNLLENAGKFTEPGTPIRLSWEGADGRVHVEVADEGGGIPPAERRQVFARYARGARARRDGLPGSGLGLALGRELLAGMGGTLRLLETAERGATFRITLPGADDGG